MFKVTSSQSFGGLFPVHTFVDGNSDLLILMRDDLILYPEYTHIKNAFSIVEVEDRIDGALLVKRLQDKYEIETNISDSALNKVLSAVSECELQRRAEALPVIVEDDF